MWKMALCVTSMINLSVLVIHLLQHLCQSCTLRNHYQRPDLTYIYIYIYIYICIYIYTLVCIINPSSTCAVHIFHEYILYIDRFKWPWGIFAIQVFFNFWHDICDQHSSFQDGCQFLLEPEGCAVHWLPHMGKNLGALCCVQGYGYV